MSKRNGINRQGFSLRRLILQGARATVNTTRTSSRSCDVETGRVNVLSRKQKADEFQPSTSGSRKNKSSVHTSLSDMKLEENNFCPICYQNETCDIQFFQLETCKHIFCISCLIKYLRNEINESRTDIACPQCSLAVHPNNIEELLKDCPEYIYKYEDFMVRRYLVADPDSRWCPAPDCSYAVIASGCASCPQIECKRPECGVNFCYHCKAEWHPDQTCDAARSSRHNVRTSSISFSHDSYRDDIKPCPRCQVLIVKMNDGSCNHMVCSVCGAEFCWLCMKEVSDLHYLSPSGCTFWGKKPWSRKKKILWQLGTLIGAPVGIALLAGIAVPSMVIGIPVWVGRKLLERYKTTTKHKRNFSVVIGVTASILISPALAGLAIAIGVPILLFYVYGVVPVSLCRAGCASSSTEGFKFDVDEENVVNVQSDGLSVSAISRIGGASIGDVSISVTSGSQVGMQNSNALSNNQYSCQESTVALAGSVTGKKNELQANYMSADNSSAITGNSEKSVITDNFSTKGLSGSLASYKQDISDKCSVHSNKSFLGSERIMEKDFIDSIGKRTIHNSRIKNSGVHRKLSPEIQSASNCISEDCAECSCGDMFYYEE